MKTKLWYIKQRWNPQLGTYHTACGQLPKAAARRMERSLYGDNVMIPFETEIAYNARLDELRKSGERVH